MWDTQTALIAAGIAFVFGAVLGSFISVVAHRVPRGQSIVTGRSKCPHCDHQIAAYDNVPILSWLILRGRCRSCHAPISLRYPLIELGLGAAFSAAVLVLHDDGTQLALGLLLLVTLAAVTLTDLEQRIIPNSILAFAAVASIAIVAAADPSGLPERGLAAVAAGGFFLLAALLYPRGMGMGDVKLAALIGFFLGRDAAPAILVALLTGAVVGLAIIAQQGSAGRKQAVPFGPFLALGAVVGLLAGTGMLDWYLNTFINS